MKSKKASGEFATFILICVVIVGIFIMGFWGRQLQAKSTMIKNIETAHNNCMNHKFDINDSGLSEEEFEQFKTFYYIGCTQYPIYLMETYTNE